MVLFCCLACICKQVYSALSDARPLRCWGCYSKPSRYTFLSAPHEVKSNSYRLFLLFEKKEEKKGLLKAWQKEVIPHDVTIFPCIKEVTLRYWNQNGATQGFPFYLEEIKGSRGLPTNNHLALSPRVIWPTLMKAKLSFYNTNHSGSSPCHMKTAQNMPTSANIWKIFLKVNAL